MSRHTDPLARSTEVTNTCGSPRSCFTRRLLHWQWHKSDKNIPVNLAQTAAAALPLCINGFKMFNLNQHEETCPAAAPCPTYGWRLDWERHHVFSISCTNSTGQMELPRVDQPQVPNTVEKLLHSLSGIQGGKLSTAKKIQFMQTPVASLWTLVSVFRQLRSEFWHHWIELFVFFSH